MHLLVVDNNQELARFAIKLLNRYAGHTGEIALNPDTALSMASQHEFGAILIEFRLPHQNVGLNLAKLLREQGYNGLIIAFVTIPDTFTVEKMIEMGFNACIQKTSLAEYIDIFNIAPGTICFEGDDLVYEKDRKQ